MRRDRYAICFGQLRTVGFWGDGEPSGRKRIERKLCGVGSVRFEVKEER